MDTKKVIITLLILTIVLSLLTIAFNTLSEKKIFIDERKSGDQATVGLYVEGGKPIVGSTNNDNSNVGLYVEGS